MTRPAIAPATTEGRNVKWGDEPGGMIVGAIAYDDTFQGTVYGTEPPVLATWSNGNPKMVRVITLVTVSSNLTDTQGEDIGPGDIVNLYLNSYTDQKAYRAALKAHGSEVNVGDQVKAEFTHVKDRAKVKHFQFRAVDESDPLVAAAVDEYERRKQAEQTISQPAPAPAPASAPAPSPWGPAASDGRPTPVEEPF